MLGLMSFGAPSCLLIGGRTLAADSFPPESGADARRAQRTAILCCGVWEMSPSGADIYMLHYTHSTPQSHTPHHKARGATLEATPVLHARQFKNTGGPRAAGAVRRAGHESQTRDGTQNRSLSSSLLSPDLVSWIVS